MKKLGNYALSLVLRGIGVISSLIPHQLLQKLGWVLGFILRVVSKKRYKITLINLQLAFPEKTTIWHQKTARDSYRNLGIVLAEILSFPHLNNSKLEKLIRFKNIELLQNAYSCNKGLLLLSGHYGNWELLAYSAGLLSNISINVVAIQQHNHYADEYITRFRTRHNNAVIPTANAAKKIVQTLLNHKAVAMLADQAADGTKDIFIEFFGRPAATYEAPAALALKFGVPIIIGFAKRNDDGIYSVELEEITLDDLEYSKDGIIELTKRHVAALERAIRDKPELWAWQHNRWKQ